MHMKILVTGSTGFIGSSLCRALCAQGHQVFAFHRPTSTLRMLEDLPVEHLLGDLTRPETVADAVEGKDVVFHAAALLGGEQSGRMYAVTVEGTRTVLQAALLAGVQRVVHTSSVAALGVPEYGLSHALPLDENHAWNFRPDYWPYGYAKHLAETEVQKAVAQGLDAVIVNPSVVFGSGDVYRQSSSMIVKTARRRLPALVEGGSNIVHIDDVVEGHLAALERGRCGERYILGGENLTHTQLLQQIAAMTGTNLPAVVLPASIARRLVLPLRLAQPFLDLPLSFRSFYLAGYQFFYNTARARETLGVPLARPAQQALQDAYDWFVSVGAIPRSRSSPG